VKNIVNFGFKFSTLYFLNCDARAKTTSDVFDTIKNLCIMIGVNAEMHECQTKEKLKTSFRVIEARAKNDGDVPFLHLESHGSRLGIRLESGAKFTRGELSEWFCRINVACQNNLMVFLAACSGGFTATTFLDFLTKNGKEQRAPMLALIGPNTDITLGHLHPKIEEFYTTLLKKEKRDLYKAVEILNDEGDSSTEPFFYCTSVQIFHDFMERYIAGDMADRFKDRQSFLAHIEEIKAQFIAEKGFPAGEMAVRQLAVTLLDEETYRGMLNEIWTNYFTVDFYPENRSRFPHVGGINGWDEMVERVSKV
jgi:hypothetical protein